MIEFIQLIYLGILWPIEGKTLMNLFTEGDIVNTQEIDLLNGIQMGCGTWI